jgi:hypothetical protein
MNIHVALGYINSVAIPLQIRCKSHFSPILRNGLASSLVRLYNGGTTIVEQTTGERLNRKIPLA